MTALDARDQGPPPSSSATEAVAFVDVQAVQNPSSAQRGVGRYVHELIQAITEAEPTRIARYLLNRDWPILDSVEPLAATGRLRFSDTVASGAGAVLHVPHAFEPSRIDRIWPPALRDLPLVVTLHDFAPFVFPDLHMPDPRVRRWYHTRLEFVRRAERIVAVSEATAADAVKWLGVSPERIMVSGEGAADHFTQPEDRHRSLAAAQERFPWLEPGFLLYTGGMNPRKNVDGLLEAYAALSEGVRAAHQLVVVCSLSTEERLAVEERLAALRIAGRAHFPGFVPDDELVLLYQAAELFVFPSFYEGFGLPVAEAMSCGAAVVAARTSSLTELVKDERALFDPHDVRSIRETIETCLTNHTMLEQLRDNRLEERFTWRYAAERTVETYEAALRSRGPVRSRRRRIAFVSPPPSVPAGRDSSRLATELSAHCSVDVYFPGGRPEAESPGGVAVWQTERFESIDRLRGGYDNVVYRLGHGPEYAPALSLFQHRPGSVLADSVSVRDGTGADVLARADHFLAQSRFAAQLARLEAGGDDETKIFVVRYGIHGPNPSAGPAAEDSVIAIVAPSFPDGRQKVDEAFALVSSRHPTAKLSVAGPREGPGSDGLPAIAVHLFDGMDGATPTAVTEHLSAGVATIVTASGAARELPDACAVKIRRDVTAVELAEEVSRLLTDRERRAELVAAGIEYASRNSYAQAAADVYAALTAAASADPT